MPKKRRSSGSGKVTVHNVAGNVRPSKKSTRDPIGFGKRKKGPWA